MVELSKQVQFDRQLMQAYVLNLQSEIEAKRRDVTRFRDTMNVLAACRTPEALGYQLETVRQLIEQIDGMLDTNKIVRETLVELLDVAKALARDLRAGGI